MAKKVIRLTESQLKEIINDKLAQSYGGDSHSFPQGSGQWNTTEEKENNEKTYTKEEVKKILDEIGNCTLDGNVDEDGNSVIPFYCFQRIYDKFNVK